LESSVTFTGTLRVPANWGDASIWSSGVPQASGDIANLVAPVLLRSDASLNVNTPVTIGELRANGVTPILVTGSNPLVFNNGAVGTGLISTTHLTPTNPARQAGATFRVPIQAAAGQALAITAGQNAPLRFESRIDADSTVTLTGPVTLQSGSPGLTGTVWLVGANVTVATANGLGSPTAATRIDSRSTLRLLAASNESFHLAGGTLIAENVDLSGPIYLESDSTVSMRPSGSLPVTRVVSGPISGPGGLTIGMSPPSAAATLRLTGANSYEGPTYVVGGAVEAANATAFGSATAPTYIQGGASVRVSVPTDERFVLDSGSLAFGAGTTPVQPSLRIGNGVVSVSGPVLAMQIEVANGGGGQVATLNHVDFPAPSWVGGSVGVGDMALAGGVIANAPLAHQGGLELRGATLSAANRHSGATRISGGTSAINHPDALGLSDSPLDVASGEVTFNAAPRTPRDAIVRAGVLYVSPTAGAFDGRIVLTGEGQGQVGGGGVFNGSVEVRPTAVGDHVLSDGVFNGPVRGDGSLTLSGAIQLNAANDLRGSIRVGRASGFSVEANHAQAINTPNTRVEGGSLVYNVEVVGQPVMARGVGFGDTGGRVVLNVPQRMSRPWVVNAGELVVGSRIEADELVLVGTGVQAKLGSTAGGVLSLTGELRSEHDSMISAPLAGGGVVRARGARTIVQGDLSAFTGDLRAERGDLLIDSASTLSDLAAVYVGPDATLIIRDNTAVVRSDIHFAGKRSGGSEASYLSAGGNGSSQIFAGDLFFSSPGARLAGNMSLTGDLVGSAMTHEGGLTIAGRVAGLTERLQANGGVRIADTGSIVDVRELLIAPGGSLALAPSASSDRIDDSTVVRMQGGQLSVERTASLRSSERVGTVRVERGRVRIIGAAWTNAPPGGLSIGELVRERGTTVRFAHTDPPRIDRIGGQPTPNGSMIGGGFVVSPGGLPDTFATLDDQGRVGRVEPTRTTIVGASPTDHVRMAGNEALAADTTVASIIGLGDIDLRGRTIHVRSGGVIGSARVSNGRMTAGDGDGAAELIFHNGARIEADIVDSPSGDSVSLVLAGGTTLSGVNTYTGGTYVSGPGDFFSLHEVQIGSPAAVPARDKLHVHSARYTAGGVFSRETPYESISVTGGGSFYFGTNAVRADRIDLESGSFAAELVGGGVITKRGPDFASIDSYGGPSFVGEVRVEEGRLSVGGRLLDAATTYVTGGRLVTTSTSGRVRLRGGEFEFGTHATDLELDSDSTLISPRGGLSYVSGALVGAGNLHVRGPAGDFFESGVYLQKPTDRFNGDVFVESGTLFLSRAGVVGDAEIAVSGGGRLFVGGVNDATPINLSNDIVLSGGMLAAYQPSRFGDPLGGTRVISGDVTVEGASYIGATYFAQGGAGLSLQGTVRLRDGATVLGMGDARHTEHTLRFGDEIVEVAGVLEVGDSSAWNILTTTLRVTGSVRPAGDRGEIDFRGSTEQFDLSAATFNAPAGSGLSVLVNGERQSVSLVGAGAGLSGGGLLAGDFRVSEGAAISPGDSIGALSLDGDVRIDGGAVLNIEVAGPLSDELQVTGVIDFTAIGGVPWTLHVPDLGGGPPGSGWRIATGDQILGFNSGGVRLVSGNPSLDASAYTIEQRGSSLFLTLIPEPSSCCLIGTAALIVVGRPRAARRRPRDLRDALPPRVARRIGRAKGMTQRPPSCSIGLPIGVRLGPEPAKIRLAPAKPCCR
jgi:autotransporter-associated beta strand protein